MTHKGLLAALAACAALACTALPLPGSGDRLVSRAYADGVRGGHGSAKWRRPAPGYYYGRRAPGYYYNGQYYAPVYAGGFYSYIDLDVVNSWSFAVSEFIGNSEFRTPFSDQQSPGGPFDSGFFFDSGMGPRFNDSPYPR
jgi:hypothetical protein